MAIDRTHGFFREESPDRFEGSDADTGAIYHRFFIQFLSTGGYDMKKETPSMDAWLREAKAHESAPKIGMYLTHNGIVRQSAKAKVRYGEDAQDVTGMVFSYDQSKVDAVLADAQKLDGIYYIRVWLNQGALKVGDDIMYVLIGGDIRPRVVDALNYIVGRIKNECVTETELN